MEKGNSMNIHKLLEIGLINTLRLNIRYFGLSGMFHPVILASRHLKIQKMEGQVIVHDRALGGSPDWIWPCGYS